MMSSYILFITGIGIVVMALALIKKDVYNNSNSSKVFEQKEDELLKNIEIADDIIKELNDISDSIIQKLDGKISEINDLLKKAEEKTVSYEKEKIINTEIQNPEEQTAEKYIKEDNIKKIELKKNSRLPYKELEKIIELQDKGYNSSQIAKFLNKGIGEINLIMNLKKR